MNRFVVFFVFVSLLLPAVALGQVNCTKTFSYEQKLIAFKEIEKQFGYSLPNNIQYNVSLEVKIFSKKNEIRLHLFLFVHSVDGIEPYRGFSLSDLFTFGVADFEAAIKISQKIIPLQIKKTIPENNLIWEGTYTSIDTINACDIAVSSFKIDFPDRFDENFIDRLQKIDYYFLHDSLFAQWSNELDKLNAEDVDLLPLAPFTLRKIRKEAETYTSLNFENLLSDSKLDNLEYLKKMSSLFRKMDNLDLQFEQRLANIDELFYQKALLFEKEENYDRAKHYFQRALDYNPTHFKACSALTHLLIPEKEYIRAIQILARLYQDTSQKTDEYFSVAIDLYEILCQRAEQLIDEHKFYDASKALDTVSLFCVSMPVGFCGYKYENLRKQAYDGIYNSYFDIIKQAFERRQMVLVSDYLKSLDIVMKKNGDTLQNHEVYLSLVKRLLDNFSVNVSQRVEQKQYEKLFSEITATKSLLDTLLYPYQEELFKEAYRLYYTNLYAEKLKEIEIEIQKEHSLFLLQKMDEADSLYLNYEAYITLPKRDFSLERQKRLKQKHYDDLCLYILQTNPSPDDLNFLDSCLLKKRLQERFTYKQINIDSVIEQKCTPLFVHTFSTINMYCWGNEFDKAFALFSRLDSLFFGLGFDADSTLSVRYQKTDSLLRQQTCLYQEKQLMEIYKKAYQLKEQKKYLQAEELLRSVRYSSKCERSPNQEFINSLQTFVRRPARFEKLYQEALICFEKYDYQTGFATYEKAYRYFIDYDVQTYGLNCDSLIAFIKKQNHVRYYEAFCVEKIMEKHFDEVFEIFFYATEEKNFSMEKVQQQFGTALRKYVKENKLNRYQEIKKYSFTKIHTPFLSAYLGKADAKFYLLLHVKKEN